MKTYLLALSTVLSGITFVVGVGLLSAGVSNGRPLMTAVGAMLLVGGLAAEGITGAIIFKINQGRW